MFYIIYFIFKICANVMSQKMIKKTNKRVLQTMEFITGIHKNVIRLPS